MGLGGAAGVWVSYASAGKSLPITLKHRLQVCGVFPRRAEPGTGSPGVPGSPGDRCPMLSGHRAGRRSVDASCEEGPVHSPLLEERVSGQPSEAGAEALGGARDHTAGEGTPGCRHPMCGSVGVLLPAPVGLV